MGLGARYPLPLQLSEFLYDMQSETPAALQIGDPH